MFGLKLIKSQDYKDLNWRLEQALKLIDEKDAKLAKQSAYISDLEEKIDILKNENAEKKASNKSILLTDVAEKPLKVEKSKKKEGTTPRKRIRKNAE